MLNNVAIVGRVVRDLELKELVGSKINKIVNDEDYIAFITNENVELRISKFIPYCSCYVGEYIDEISQDGNCCGIITAVESNIKYSNDYYEVYKGNVVFYFENGKINMNVHGEDNGYYGVCFKCPVEVIDVFKKKGE